MAIIGYARVSTAEQKLQLQLDALNAAGCDHIYQDVAQGKRTDRPQLIAALQNLMPGDTFIVWKLDRLGRSVAHLVSLVNDLASRQVQFKSLTDAIDTSSTSGRFFFNVMASLAEMERELIAERTKAGLIAAKARGQHLGRPKVMTAQKLSAALALIDAKTHSPKSAAAVIGVSRATLFRHLKKAKK